MLSRAEGPRRFVKFSMTHVARSLPGTYLYSGIVVVFCLRLCVCRLCDEFELCNFLQIFKYDFFSYTIYNN